MLWVSYNLLKITCVLTPYKWDNSFIESVEIIWVLSFKSSAGTKNSPATALQKISSSDNSLFSHIALSPSNKWVNSWNNVNILPLVVSLPFNNIIGISSWKILRVPSLEQSY